LAPKISIIGAGSAVFSPGLVTDICLTPNLAGSTISFVDINEARLDAIHRLCERFADEIGIELRLEKTRNCSKINLSEVSVLAKRLRCKPYTVCFSLNTAHARCI
jgi:alpha-galactosidase/6-phospho-beta-glucosidase family protein